MYKLGKKSLRELKTCDERLRRIAYYAINVYDFSVLEGARSYERQKELFISGRSKSMKSKHLVDKENPLSRAFDLMPYPFVEGDWDNKLKYTYMAGMIMGIAHYFEIPLVWGGDWDETKDPSLTKFFDGGHFHLKGES